MSFVHFNIFSGVSILLLDIYLLILHLDKLLEKQDNIKAILFFTYTYILFCISIPLANGIFHCPQLSECLNTYKPYKLPGDMRLYELLSVL